MYDLKEMRKLKEEALDALCGELAFEAVVIKSKELWQFVRYVL